MKIFVDGETRSAFDLKSGGSHRYWRHPTTRVLCLSWAIDDGKVSTWFPGDPIPQDIMDAHEAGADWSGWNSLGFEALMFEQVLTPVFGWPVIPLERWIDTMELAAAMNLPQALGECARVTGVDSQKDNDGYKLMMKMCKPRKPKKGEPEENPEDPHGHYWLEDDESLQRLARYCERDVETERALAAHLLPLPDSEREISQMTARMNMRGMHVDRELVKAMDQIIVGGKPELDAKIAELTGGRVTSLSQNAALSAFLGEQGLKETSLAKDVLATNLERTDLSPLVRQILELRRDGAKSSNAKLDAFMATTTDEDPKSRGGYQYHGASTGRWAGRGVQPHNMPRGTKTIKDPDEAVDIMMTGDSNLVSMCYGNPVFAVSDMLRSCITATPGNRLLAADYSAIEGRVTAWYARDNNSLRAYRLNDTLILDDKGQPIPDPNDKGEFLRAGPENYLIAAAGIYGVDVASLNKKSPERQTGKVAELALGFQGGVGAFHAMAKTYRTDMSTVYDPICAAAGYDMVQSATEKYREYHESKQYLAGELDEKTWVASDLTKQLWRESHPEIVDLWKDLEAAAIAAVQDPGSIHEVNGRCRFIVNRNFLWFQLPSKRCLAYAAPRLEETTTPWGDKRQQVTVMGMKALAGTTTRKWMRYSLYGGILTENCLAGDTEVLTDAGWIRLDAITRAHRVWDGEEWVSHDGLISQGVKPALVLDGIRMTPDHKVLTSKGWKNAASCQGLRRAASNSDRAEEQIRRARDVRSSSISSVGSDDRPLPEAFAPVVQGLRGPGGDRMSGMAHVQPVLGGHGLNVSVRTDNRTAQQRGGLLGGELRLGDTRPAVTQQTEQPSGQSDRYRQRDGDCAWHVVLAVVETPVFDIRNAGPRTRFVVRAPGGQREPLIVHNCVQASARDLMAYGMRQAEKAGYPLVMTVHDEAVADVPLGFGSLEEYSAHLCEIPDWAEGMPLVAAGYESLRYKKD